MRAPEINIVQAFVRSAASSVHTPQIHLYPTVALSRDYGAGGEEVARMLAQALGVRCLDGELIDAIAADARDNREAVKSMDERVRSLVDDWLYNFFTQQKVDEMSYLVHLIHVMLDVPEHGGGVIVGRGGALVLPRAQAFRVKICGSLGACAERVMREENIGRLQAEEKIKAINTERAEFIRSRFTHDPTDLTIYDLVIVTDRLNTEQAMRLILHGMFLAGFELPASALVKLPVRRAPELSSAR